MTEEIIICSKCKGYGRVERSKLVCHHNGDYEYWDIVCSVCDGNGRIFKTTDIKYRKLTKEELEIRGVR